MTSCKAMSAWLVMAAAWIALLAGCAGLVPEYRAYQSWYPGAGGYQETNLGGTRWMVSYVKSNFMSRATAIEYANRRAMEVCMQHGYSTFDLIDQLHEFNEVTLQIACKPLPD